VATRDTGSNNFGLWLVEIEGASAVDESAASSDATTEPTLSLTPVTSDPIIVLSFVSVRSDSNQAFTPAASMTEIVDDYLATTGTNGPQIAINYRVITSPAGSYTVGSTYGAGSKRAVIAASFVAVAGDVLYLTAPAVHDNDDATFEYVDVSILEFLRGTLDSAPVLESIEMRLALENAGSATISVYGSNDSDFDSETLLDSVTFTGTGSYTAQDITFELPGGTGYQYLRFELAVAQGIHVHEVELYGPTLSGSHDHTHDHDDDYQTVRYGSGDVLSTIGATGATETIDLANGNVHQLTLNANCTFTFTGADSGRARSFRLYLWQDEVGGWDVTWPASVEWAGGTPTISTTAETLSVFMFETLDGGTVWHGYPVGTTDLRWEPVTHNPGSGPELVWDGDDLVMEFKEYA
jgi:hypothetical protein